MGNIRYYGIKYPFSTENNDSIFIDLNESFTDKTKSDVLHVIFTPKGQRLRNPDFGTNLIKYIFEPSDEITLESIKEEITSNLCKWVSNIEFKDIRIEDAKDNNSKIVIVKYDVIKGNLRETNVVGVKI